MGSPRGERLRPAYQVLVVAAATSGATLACLWIDPRMSVAGLAMVYLLVVVGVSFVLSRTAAVAAALASVSALNFFFVPPRLTFQVSGVEYWWTLAVFLAVSLALSALIANLREGRVRAERGESRAAQLHALSEALASCEGAARQAQRAAQWLNEHLGRPCAIYLRTADAPACWSAPAQHPDLHPRSAQWAIENGRPLGRGCDDWADLPLWCAPFSRRDPQGAVQVLLGAHDRPSADVLQHWHALVRQVGLSIEREGAAQAARAAQEQARAEAQRNTLLASLSHDLRTPLAAIVGSASTLRAQGDQLTPAQRDRLLANLEHEARDMTLMADNILQMARFSQPQWRLKTQWESLEEILGAAVARMRRRWPHARIQLRVTAGLPPIQAEAALLAQVVANLVDNAVRHGGEPAQVAIQAGRSREGVFVAVRDHGPGLAAEQLEHVFDRYAPGGTHAEGGGAGLGLAICKLVAQAHGGRIAVQACEPGTEFRLDLPAAAREELAHG
jgi:two-component system sensor histidine kinase KdpD